MLPQFAGVATIQDVTLRRVQEAVARTLRRVTQCPLLDGLLLGPLAFTANTPLTVAHRLGRAPLGYIVADVTAPVRLWRVPAADQTKTITFQADATCTATLWVF